MGNQCQCVEGQDNKEMDPNAIKKTNANQFQSSTVLVQQMTELNIPYQTKQIIRKMQKKKDFQSLPNTKVYKIKYREQPCYYLCQNMKAGQLPNGFAVAYLLDHKQNFEGFYEGYVQNAEAQDQQGLYIMKDGSVYEGSIKQSKASGKGKYTNKNQNFQYEGSWVSNLPHGQGVLKNQDGVYTGIFDKGRKTGQGKFVRKDGTEYRGQFRQGVTFGKGYLKNASGDTYQGDFQNGIPHGQGKWKSGSQSYIGTFQKGRRQGDGKYKFSDQSIFDGIFKNQKPEGRGQLLKNGQIIHGIWNDGVLVHILAVEKQVGNNQWDKLSQQYSFLTKSRERVDQ